MHTMKPPPSIYLKTAPSPPPHTQGPLVLRLAVLRAMQSDHISTPGLVWVLHGEEEIGSPFAHEIYPRLSATLPQVSQGSGSVTSDCRMPACFLQQLLPVCLQV